eukprot:9287876-Lingulodinium_polyedra.AAC.1
MSEHSLHSASSDLRSVTNDDGNMTSSAAEHPEFCDLSDMHPVMPLRQHDCSLDLSANAVADELQAVWCKPCHMWLRRSQWHGHVRGKRHRHNARLQLAADACTA